MEQIIHCINPSFTLETVKKHLPHVQTKLQQITEDEDYILYGKTKSIIKKTLVCSDCKNYNMSNMIRDELSGDYICLGRDGKGCGLVLDHSELIPPSSMVPCYEEDPSIMDLFSTQRKFQSYMVGGSCSLRKTNELVEKMMSQVGKTDQTTSDFFKDKQRSQVYDMIDQLHIICKEATVEVCEDVKFLFHEYRTKVTRIHKLPLVLCCLFYIAISK